MKFVLNFLINYQNFNLYLLYQIKFQKLNIIHLCLYIVFSELNLFIENSNIYLLIILLFFQMMILMHYLFLFFNVSKEKMDK